MTHSYDDTKDFLDPRRYEMPGQTFDITLSNVYGDGAAVYSYDPIKDTKLPLQIIGTDSEHITVRVESVDYPRFLIIEEQEVGPLIEHVALEKTDHGATVSFVTNVDGLAQISWGAYPVRSGGTFKEDRYTFSQPRKLVSEREVNSVNYFNSLPAEPGFWRWTGTIVPQHSENYTFVVSTDQMNTIRVWIDDQLLVEGNGKITGTISLESGKSYQVRFEYTHEYAVPHTAILYWFSSSQPKEVVPAVSKGANQIAKRVYAGQRESFLLPGMNDGDGVKIELSNENNRTQYPQWSYDTRGILRSQALVP